MLNKTLVVSTTLLTMILFPNVTFFSSLGNTILFALRRPPNGNVPILIYKEKNEINISGKLEKSGTLFHDSKVFEAYDTYRQTKYFFH